MKDVSDCEALWSRGEGFRVGQRYESVLEMRLEREYVLRETVVDVRVRRERETREKAVGS